MANINFRPLTALENFSLTEMFTTKMHKWNHDTVHPVLKPIAARIVGCALVAFAALADVLVHAALTLGKTVAAVAVLPFRPFFNLPQDVELSSPLIHLMRSTHSIFNVVILPLLCLLDPDRAYQITQTTNIVKLKHKITKLQQEFNEEQKSNQTVVEVLQKDYIEAQNKIEQLNANIEKLKKETKEPVNPSLLAISEEEEQIATLIKEKAGFEEQVENLRKEKSEQDKAHQSKMNVILKEIGTLKADLKEIEILQAENEKLKKKNDELQMVYDLYKENQQKPAMNLRDVVQIPPPIDKLSNSALNAVFPSSLPLPPVQEDFVSTQNQPLSDSDDDPDVEENTFYRSLERSLEVKEPEVNNNNQPDWSLKERQELIRDTVNIHSQVMQQIKGFQAFKPKNQSEKKVILKAKHRANIENIGNQKNRVALLSLRRHILELSGFCEAALKSKKMDLEDLNASTYDWMQSTIERIQPDNLEAGLIKTINYLEAYLEDLKPKLEELAKPPKNVEETKATEEFDRAKVVQEQGTNRKQSGFLTQKEALELITLTNGKVKIYEDEQEVEVNVVKDMISRVNQSKANIYIATRKQEFMKISKEQQFANWEDFKKVLENLQTQIKNSEDYKPTSEFNLIKDIVIWFNDRNYLK